MSEDSAVAPFPPERPADDPRPETQKIQEARAAEAALAGEHGTDGPPQYVDAPEPEGHNAGDYVEPGTESPSKKKQDKADQKAADDSKDDDDKRDKGSAAAR